MSFRITQPGTDLINIFRDGRIRAKMSQKELAEELGLGPAQIISNYERLQCMPPAIHVKKICDVLGVNFMRVSELYLEHKKEIIMDKMQKGTV